MSSKEKVLILLRFYAVTLGEYLRLIELKVGINLIKERILRSQVGHWEYTRELRTLFPKQKKAIQIAYRNWKWADYLFAIGKYHDSVAVRKTVLDSLDGTYSCASGQETRFIPQYFTVAIGHLSILYMREKAKDLKFLPQSKDIFFRGSTTANEEAFQFITHKKSVIKGDKFEILGTLSLSRLAENLLLFRSENDYIDLYTLWEKTSKELSKAQSSTEELKIKLADSAEEKLHDFGEKLKALGVSETDKLAVIHVRDTGNPSDLRNASIENYSESIKELLKNGYKVFRIGNDIMPKSSICNEGFFDLTQGKLANYLEDFFLLALCDLFIGTTSGPYGFPLLFGKPTLVTNLTSPARNALSAQRTMYLPKTILDNRLKRSWTLEEYLHSPFAFGGEYLAEQLDKHGLKMMENNSTEIFEATRDLLSAIDSNNFGANGDMKIVDNWRNESKCIAFGEIANSYISKHLKS
jgi:putative glycosyltransferase (TIGR04372 family)